MFDQPLSVSSSSNLEECSHLAKAMLQGEETRKNFAHIVYLFIYDRQSLFQVGNSMILLPTRL